MFANRFIRVLALLPVLVAAIFSVSFVTRSTSARHVDSSYDQVEQLRTIRGATTDRGYDLIEGVRINRPTNAAADRGYDLIEQLRIVRSTNIPGIDRSYDLIENVRAQRTY